MKLCVSRKKMKKTKQKKTKLKIKRGATRASHPIFIRGDKMSKNEKLSFLVRDRVSNSDATVVLKNENGKLFCEINAHLFESRDKQLTITPINEQMVIIINPQLKPK